MASSFFKILLDPSADHMSLPPDFACMHVENKITNNPIIQYANGGYYSWRLKIEQIGDDYCFVNGWNNVVKDIRLGFGDFLLFKLVDQSTFRLSIYSPDGCEKILQPKTDQNCDEKIEEKSDDDDDPFFVVIFTLSHARFLRFPEGFAELMGIDAEGPIKVKNLDGKEWGTGLKLDKSYRSMIRYFLSPGWPRFARENKLAEGDECVFKFIRSEGKLLLAKVTKKKSREIQVAAEAMRRARGRALANRKNGGDVDVDHDEECVEATEKPFEMPPKRRCGSQP
ncbi:B3 domain-containing protein REM5-like [Helianthus annuus]|nr:B3 domain-containing protein REM5-like [Helianthus annuus]